MSDTGSRWTTVPVKQLEQRILNKVGRETGRVDFYEERANYGGTGCDTCDPPEIGFCVAVDDERVWPTDETSNEYGGWTWIDVEGTYNRYDKTLTYDMDMGDFYNWLETPNKQEQEEQEQETMEPEENETNQITTLLVNLVDQAPLRVVENTLTRVRSRITNYQLNPNELNVKQTALSILAELVQNLAPARLNLDEKIQDYTAVEAHKALFNVVQRVRTIDRDTADESVVEYAETIAQAILAATTPDIPDTCDQ